MDGTFAVGVQSYVLDLLIIAKAINMEQGKNMGNTCIQETVWVL